MSLNTTSQLPENSLVPVKQSARSRLDIAMRDVSKWPPQDKAFFIAAFTTRKSSSQLASEMGLSQSGYQARHRDLLRRFMRAAKPSPAAL